MEFSFARIDTRCYHAVLTREEIAMQTTDEQKPVIEEQYDQILQLRRRLMIATCVAIVSTAAFVGVSILLGVTHLSDGSSSFVAQQEAVMQRVLAQQAQQFANQQSMRTQQALRAQLAVFMAQQQGGMAQDGMGMMGAGDWVADDEEPVVAPVPSTE